MPGLDTVVILIAGLQGVAMVGGGFYFTGRITAVLEGLRSISADHEKRLRSLERLPTTTTALRS